MRRPRTIPRVHVEAALAQGALVTLPPGASHHLARVLRIAVGEAIVVFGQGLEFPATVTKVDKKAIFAKLGPPRSVDRESSLDCVLAQGVSSGERMDVTLQKAVELGVSKVQPIFSERSVVRLSDERLQKRCEHWREVMISACEQCGRNVVPELAPPLALWDWLSRLGDCIESESRLLLSPLATARLRELDPPQRITLLVGPEGGFSELEIDQALRRGFVSVRLGPRVLRTETAAMAAMSAMNALWGDY